MTSTLCVFCDDEILRWKHKIGLLPLRHGSYRERKQATALIFDEESASDAQKFLAPPKLVILEKKNWQKRENINKYQKNSKKSENVRTLPNASERIRTCPNASGKVRTGPNTSPNLRKLRKTCENFEKFRDLFYQLIAN